MLRSTTARDDNGWLVADITSSYVVCDGPTEAQGSDDVLYYGAVAHDGSWMIRKRTISAGTERFATGRAAYTTAWADPTSQTYDRPDRKF